MLRIGVVLAALACALVASASAPSSGGGRPFLVGVDDDQAKWQTRPDRLIATYRDLGLGAVRLTIPWHRGQTRPTAEAGVYLHRAAQMMARGERVVLAVYGRPWQAPLDERQRSYYCDFLRHVTGRIPVRDIVVWNEVNSPQFWPQGEGAGAAAYEALLAACWDRLRRVAPAVNLLSTTAAHWDPAGFIRAMGEAYRASGRRRPIVTTFGHNPYPDTSAEPPWTRHEDPRTVGQGDLPRLLLAIEDAFGGTGQPTPASGGAPVWYLENGFQTTVPAHKRRFYTGEETELWTIPALGRAGLDPLFRDQARQLRDALLLAYCQPEVEAYFNFELTDEVRLAGWQSGVLWRDGTRKPSYQAFKQAVALVRSGAVDCAEVPGAGGPIPRPPDDPSDKALRHAVAPGTGPRATPGRSPKSAGARSEERRPRSARLSGARGRSSVG